MKKKKIKEDKWVTQFNGLKTIKLAQKGRAWSKSNKTTSVQKPEN